MTAINKRSPDSRALVLALMVAFAYCLGVSACQDHSSSDPDVVAFVNGTPITVAQFTAALHRLDQNARAGRLPRLDEKMKLVVLRDLIDRRIVLLRANQLGLSVSDQELNLAIAEVQKDYSAESFRDMIIKQYIDIETWKREIRFRLLLQKVFQVDVKDRLEPTDEQINAFYNKNIARYQAPMAVKALHIVISDKKRATRLRNMLIAGNKVRSAIIAVKLNPEHANHGRPVKLSQGQMPEKFDKTVMGLAIGKWSPVLKSPYGYHLIKIVKKMPAGTTPLVEVRKKIAAQIRLELRDRAFAKWMQGLRDKAKIDINRALLAPNTIKSVPKSSRGRS